MTEVIALWELNPKSPIKLADDIYLVRITDLVPSQARDTVTGIDQNRSGVRSLMPKPNCKAAIKRDFKHENILLKPEQQSGSLIAALAEMPMTDSLPDFAKAFLDKVKQHPETQPNNIASHPDTTRMNEIVRCLCLLDDSSVCEFAHWYESTLSTPIIGGVGGWGCQAMEHLFHIEIKAEDYDEPSCQSLVGKFLGLSDGDRQRLYVPLSRLNTALRETDSSDKALDLGIAFESLLGDDKPLDLSYKVRQRGTFFLGGTPDQRRYNFDHLKKLYDLRSKVAHGKRLDSTFALSGQYIATEQFLKECCTICAQLSVDLSNLDWFLTGMN